MWREGVQFFAMHWYCYVPCKTQGCASRLLVKYLGSDNEVGELGSFTLSYTGLPLLVHCEGCDKTCSYSLEDIQICELADPPQPDFEDRF